MFTNRESPLLESILILKKERNAVILAHNYQLDEVQVTVHPECRPDVIALADEVLSTSGMIRFAQRDEVKEIIVGTEIGIIHRLRKENPGKRFIPASE